jgi:hypothetical protein
MMKKIALLSKFKLPLVAITLSISTVFAIGAFAVECETCRKSFDALREQLALRDKTVSLLDQNKRYLAQLSSEDASKFLKVNSNVMMILKRLDAIKIETEKVNDTIAKNGCTECKVSSNTPKSNDNKADSGDGKYAKY